MEESKLVLCDSCPSCRKCLAKERRRQRWLQRRHKARLQRYLGYLQKLDVDPWGPSASEA